MRQQVLKALANPSRIFYVPYPLAVANFAIQFMIFIGYFVVQLILFGLDAKMEPLTFLISVIVAHSLLAAASKREPQLAQIMSAKLRLYKSRVPEQITA